MFMVTIVHPINKVRTTAEYRQLIGKGLSIQREKKSVLGGGGGGGKSKSGKNVMVSKQTRY